jgi:hypothetical protein
MLFAVVLCELIDDGRPSAIVLELSEISPSGLNQLEKHVPGVFLNYLKIFLLVAEEVDPVREETALTLEQKLPEVEGDFRLQILKGLISREIIDELVHLLELFRVLQVILKLWELLLKFISSADSQGLEPSLELRLCEGSHVEGIHLAGNKYSHNVTGISDPGVLEELLHPLDLNVACRLILVLVEGGNYLVGRCGTRGAPTLQDASDQDFLGCLIHVPTFCWLVSSVVEAEKLTNCIS